MTQGGKDINTSMAEGPARPIKKPQPPIADEREQDGMGDGRHEVPAPGERADDAADRGQKRMTRQE